MRQGISDLSGSQSALACLYVCARAQFGLREFNNALQNPHPEVPFASVGDDTMDALADLAAIVKLKL
jgi:hypothetical protein